MPFSPLNGEAPGRGRGRRRPPATGLFLLSWILFFPDGLLSSPPAAAQESAPVTSPANPSEFSDTPSPDGGANAALPTLEEAATSVEQTRAAAEAARLAYERAEAAAAAARKRADELAAAAAAAVEAAAAEEAARVAAEREALREAAGVPELERQLEEARRVAEEARAEAAAARRIAEEAQADAEAYGQRYARTGFLIGVGGNYLLEDFDTDLEVGNGRSLHAFVGYRLHRHVSLELRGEWLDEFEVEADSPAGGEFAADLDGYLITVGPKFYPLTGSIQPFVGLGVGVFRANLEGVGRDGLAIDDSETEAVIRVAGGLDYFISENFVLNLEAAYVAPGRELDVLNFGSLGAGVTFRF